MFENVLKRSILQTVRWLWSAVPLTFHSLASVYAVSLTPTLLSQDSLFP